MLWSNICCPILEPQRSLLKGLSRHARVQVSSIPERAFQTGSAIIPCCVNYNACNHAPSGCPRSHAGYSVLMPKCCFGC